MKKFYFIVMFVLASNLVFATGEGSNDNGATGPKTASFSTYVIYPFSIVNWQQANQTNALPDVIKGQVRNLTCNQGGLYIFRVQKDIRRRANFNYYASNTVNQLTITGK